MFGCKLSYVIPLIARAAALAIATKDMDLSDTPSPWQIHDFFPPKQNSSLLKSSSDSSDAFKLTMPPAHHTDMIRFNGQHAADSRRTVLGGYPHSDHACIEVLVEYMEAPDNCL